MPRELVHWAVFDQAVIRLKPKAAKLSRLLDEAKPFHRLGAVLQDAPYYLRSGRSEFVTVAKVLHGNQGEDTLEPLRVIAGQIRKFPWEEQPRIFAALAGMVSHVAADSHFHPFVYYFTGNYYEPNRTLRRLARTRHRILEVYLESWCQSKFPQEGPHSISRFLKQLAVRDSMHLEQALSEVCRVWKTPPDAKIATFDDCWRQSLSWLGFSQKLFLSPVCGAIMAGAAAVFPDSVGELEALCAFRRHEDAFFEAETFEFRNPVTGESSRASVAELFERSVASTVEYLEDLAMFLEHREEDPAALWAGKVGPSLCFGIPGARNLDATYFSQTGLPLKGLNFSAADAKSAPGTTA